MTQIYIKQNIHKHPTQNFQRISLFGITPVEKAHKARTRWYRGPFRRFINTRFRKSIKKEWTEAIKKILKYYINALQQIPVSYGSMLHIPPTNCLLLTAIQKSLSLNEKYWRIFWKKFRRKGQQAENDKTERVAGLGRRTREEKVSKMSLPVGAS